MAIIEIDGKRVEVPDNLSDAELEEVANAMAQPQKPAMSAPERLLKGIRSSVESPLAAAGSSAIRPANVAASIVAPFGLREAAEMAGEKVESAVLPIVRNAKEKLSGIPESIATSRLASVSPELAAGLGTAAHIGMLPGKLALGAAEGYAGSLKPSEMVYQVGSEAIPAFAPGLLQGVKAAGRSTGKGLFALASRKAPEDALETMVRSPEITKSGWFKKNLEGFSSDVLTSVKTLKEDAKAVASKIKTLFGSRPSAITEAKARDTVQYLKDIPKTTLADPRESAIVDRALGAINDALETAPTPAAKVQRSVSGAPVGEVERARKLSVAEAKALDGRLTGIIDESIGQVSGDTMNWLIKTRNNVRFGLEETKGAAGKMLRDSRTKAARNFANDKELTAIFGKKPDLVDFSDAQTQSKLLSWLHSAVKSGDKTVLATLDGIKPGLGAQARKLSAVSGDQFAFSMADALPAMAGLGATGYAINNPGKAGAAALAVAAVATLASPKAAATYGRGAIKAGKIAGRMGAMAGKSIPATSAAVSLLPGFTKKEQ